MSGRARLAAVVAVAIATLAPLGCASSSSNSNSDAGITGSGGGGGNIITGSGGSTGAGGTTGSGGSGGATDGGGTDGGTGTGGSGAACAVAIKPVSSGSLDGVPAGPSATLRVRGVLTGSPQPASPTWTWTVTLVQNTVSIPVTTPDPQEPSVVQFPVTQAGTYQITVGAGGNPPCAGFASATSTLTPTTSYWVRLQPPHARTDLPPSEAPISATAGQNIAHAFYFDPALPVSIDPADTAGDGVPSYVLVTSPAHSWSREGDTSAAAFTTSLSDTPSSLYDVLIVPIASTAGPLFAPLFFPGSAAAHIGALPITMIDPGVAVSGTLAVAGGAAVSGATVILRAGALPSTVGQSDATGAFMLLARPGSFSAAVVPPDAALLPEAHADADAGAGTGVELPSTPGATVTLGVSWRSDLPTSTLAVTVASAGGSVAGVGVRLDSDPGSLPDVGTMDVIGVATGTATLTATGAVHRTATTGATGAISFPALPRAAYHLTAVPPLASSDGLTVIAVDLTPASPPAAVTVNLLPKVSVSGTIKSAPAGSQILVIDDQPTLGRDVPAGAIAGDGSYAVSLDPQHAYHLLVDPPAGQSASRVQLLPVETGTTALAQGQQVFPHMLQLTGSVFAANGGTTVGGARVQVFCIGAGPDCIDPSQLGSKDPLPLIEGVTDDSGAFLLWVPDPALP